MTMKRKIFESVVLEGKDKTVAQLASQLKTTPATVRARISDIRSDGHDIVAVVKTDSKGRSKTFYTAV